MGGRPVVSLAVGCEGHRVNMAACALHLSPALLRGFALDQTETQVSAVPALSWIPRYT